MKLGSAEERFKANMESKEQLSPFAERVPIDGVPPRVYGGVRLSDENANFKQMGLPPLGQMGFAGRE